MEEGWIKLQRRAAARRSRTLSAGWDRTSGCHGDSAFVLSLLWVCVGEGVALLLEMFIPGVCLVEGR